MNLQENIRRILREDYDREYILYRAVGLDEAIKSCEVGHLVYYSRDPMSRDWEVIEYGLGDEASEMSEEEVDEYVNDLVSWVPNRKGVNLTSDLDNAKGYSDIVLEINLVGYDYAEFSDVHIFAKNPDDCKIKSVYYNGKEYTKEGFLDIAKSLQESIRKILREDYSPAGKEIIPNSIVVHKSNPIFRDNIMSEGLKVKDGECYKIYVGYGTKCKPAIFATNSTNKRAWFDSTYDDDIWEINTEMIPDVKWYKDRHFESIKKHIVTFQNIPSEALTLKYEGSGRNDFLEESMSEELSNEKPSFLSAIKKFGLYYFMETTQIPFTDIILKIGEPTRDILERYIIDFLMDEGEEYFDEGMVKDGEFYVTIDLYLTSMKVIDKVITDGNLLEIEVIEYERVPGNISSYYNEEVANYINESKEFSDDIIYEIFNTVRKKIYYRRR